MTRQQVKSGYKPILMFQIIVCIKIVKLLVKSDKLGETHTFVTKNYKRYPLQTIRYRDVYFSIITL